MSKTTFPHIEIQRLLSQKKNLVCVVGYEVSCEVNAPHYFDIQNGVWSKLDNQSRINPFTSEQHLKLVLNWFNWRRLHLRTNQQILLFQTLNELQKKWNINLATQCVDGLAVSNGVESITELYGNVLKVRCYNGHEFGEFLSPSNKTNNILTCEICGASLWPDMQMFGWNSKKAIREEFNKKINYARLVIKIGTSNELEPFSNNFYQLHASLPILEINRGFVLFNSNKQVYKFTQNEMLDIILPKLSEDEAKDFPRGGKFNQTMQCLIKLYE